MNAPDVSAGCRLRSLAPLARLVLLPEHVSEFPAFLRCVAVLQFYCRGMRLQVPTYRNWSAVFTFAQHVFLCNFHMAVEACTFALVPKPCLTRCVLQASRNPCWLQCRTMTSALKVLLCLLNGALATCTEETQNHGESSAAAEHASC